MESKRAKIKFTLFDNFVKIPNNIIFLTKHNLSAILEKTNLFILTKSNFPFPSLSLYPCLFLSGHQLPKLETTFLY